MRQGQLVYVMGASGSGKDSLLQALRPRLRGLPVAFARRYITRPLSAKGERHIAVSPERFAAMAASGEFVMDWQSHGLRYGIGKGIETTLAHGHVVLMNGSRGTCPKRSAVSPALSPCSWKWTLPYFGRVCWRGAGSRARILKSASPGLRCLPNIRTGYAVSTTLARWWSRRRFSTGWLRG